MGSSASEAHPAGADTPGPVPDGPLVGITAYGERARYLVWDHDVVLLPAVYVERVAAAGGVPVLLPPVPAAAAAVDALDALVLAGGPDLDPAGYGAGAHPAIPHPETGVPRPGRDALETAALHRALVRGIPVLGVCRGAQLLNTALGGTLHQHLPDALGHTGHNPAPGVFGTTDVALEPGSRLAAVLGARSAGHCHHHQGVADLAPGLEVTGRAADGTIEAVEHTAHDFVVGVQWHPEQHDDLRLFRELVRRGRLWRGSPAARP